MSIRTTVIVGLSETDKEFDELYNFVKDVEFDRLGAIFEEEGTSGAKDLKIILVVLLNKKI